MGSDHSDKVSLPDDLSLPSNQSGHAIVNCENGPKTIDKVWFVPRLTANLLFVSSMCRKYLAVSFVEGK